MTEARNAKGTRDFGAQEMQQRLEMINVFRSAFEQIGCTPLETPSFENYQTLMGKYGDEGDKLTFKLLKNGDFLKEYSPEQRAAWTSKEATPLLSDRVLRYDLTVPFARYVAQNASKITFPFKRYQIQPVWRADKPQKGRFREFYQCDADIVGSEGLYNEAELIVLLDSVFSSFQLPVVIRLNNRKILEAYATAIGADTCWNTWVVALDKYDKVGEEGVIHILTKQGCNSSIIEGTKSYFQANTTTEEIIEFLKGSIGDSELGAKGIAEISEVLRLTSALSLENALRLDLSLARGLDYYTGCIIEVEAAHAAMGSIAAGGRYDHLTQMFHSQAISGVGVSFGFERIWSILQEQKYFSSQQKGSVDLLVLNFGIQSDTQCLQWIQALRAEGISAMLFPHDAKFKKQMQYADKSNIPFVGICGEDEVASGMYKIKDLSSGEEAELTVSESIGFLKKHNA